MNLSSLTLNQDACLHTEFGAPNIHVVFADDKEALTASLVLPGLTYAAHAAYAKTPGPKALLDSLEKRMREILARTISFATPCVGWQVSVPIDRSLGLSSDPTDSDRTTGLEMSEAYGVNSLLPMAPQTLYPYDCKTNDGRYVYGYMAFAHLLYMVARQPVHTREKIKAAAIHNSHRVERVARSLRPWLDAVGNAFFKVEVVQDCLTVAFDTAHVGAWPLTRQDQAVIALHGEHTLRRIVLDSYQARMLYALYPWIFVGPPDERSVGVDFDLDVEEVS